MQTWVVVTHVVSYNVLIGSVVLYPLGVAIEFWEEVAYYHLGQQIGTSHKASNEIH